MRLKSYFVYTMEEALQIAKVELGEDAMLVDSKRLETPPGGRVRLEVIFAAPVAPPPPPKVLPLPQPLPAAAGGIARSGIAGGGIESLLRFRGELTTLLDALNRKPDTTRLEPLTPARPQLDALRARLLQSEVPPITTDEVLQRCLPVLEGLVLRDNSAASEVDRSVAPLLAAEWPHRLEVANDAARVLAVVGPAGAGKTSIIAKLAFRLAISQGRPVSVLSLDNLRIGASDQLAHICSLLGVPFQPLDYSGALPAAVAANAHRGLVLIDTPGFGSSNVELMEEAAGHLRLLDSLECHLVLPASMRYSEMQRQYRHFLPFASSRLLFTRLDETEYFGPAWAIARNNRIPVDWVSTGPEIPDDIELADSSRFAAAVLGHAVFQHKHLVNQPSPFASAANAGGASRN